MTDFSQYGIRFSSHYAGPATLRERVRALVWRMLRNTLGKLGGK